jgi:peptide/nickel transport system permease protein
MIRRRKQETFDESYFVASQWQLAWRKFRKHTLARVSLVILVVFYACGVFAEFLAPYEVSTRFADHVYAPPQAVHFVDAQGGFHVVPFVYPRTPSLDMETFQRTYVEEQTRRVPLGLFVKGDPYTFWGLFRTDIHLFGPTSRDATMLLWGTDSLGRDLFSRVLYAARVSLTIGLIGVLLSFILGVLFGSLAGYFGGAVDMAVSRVIEFLQSIPTIPLWMALAAAVPSSWSPIAVYLAISLILSVIGWTGIARTVRGKFLEVREADFILAARVAAASERQIITRHMIPSFASYLIVSLSLSVPGMIMAETGLSFLGLGLKPPVVSWGVLLQQAQSFSAIVMYSWLLLPAVLVIVTVLAFNFLGDGLRDAADPYK